MFLRPEGPSVNSHARQGVDPTVDFERSAEGAAVVERSLNFSVNLRTVAPSALDPLAVCFHALTGVAIN